MSSTPIHISTFRPMILVCLALLLTIATPSASAQNTAAQSSNPSGGAASSQQPDQPASSIPKFVRECHTMPPDQEICGNWIWTGSGDNGQEFEGRWLNGAAAKLIVERFDIGGVAISRVDSDGPMSGMTARYTGKLLGEQMTGTATFTGAGNVLGSRWIASFNVSTEEHAPPSMDSSPHALLECEGPDVCGTWSVFQQHGEAHWANRSAARLTVERFDAGGVVIRRTDLPGTLSAGLTAVYTGKLNGEFLEGSVTWTWPGHWASPQSGPWLAAFSEAEISTPAKPGVMSVEEAFVRGRLAAKSREYPLALNWFGKAGALGDARAGDKAVRLLENAKGDSSAQMLLSRMYENGWLVEPDNDKAEFWAIKANQRIGQFEPVCASAPVRKAVLQLMQQANNNTETEAMAVLLKALTGMGYKGLEFNIESAHASDAASDTEFRCDVTFAPQKSEVVDTSEAGDAGAAAGETVNESAKATPLVQEFKLVRKDNGNPAHYNVILEATGSDSSDVPRVAFTRPYTATVAVPK